MPEPIDHDALFKQLLPPFFRPFLALFLPDVAAQLTADDLLFLDKETFADLLDPDRREADFVVQAKLHAQPTTFIIHLEHQAQADPLLHERMFRYFARFLERYQTPIFPIALCSYPKPRKPARDRYQLTILAHPILDFRYRVIQLNQLDWRDYVHTPNPLAAALMARMHMQPSERWAVKAAGLRLMAQLPMSGAERRMLGQFIDIYLPLNAVQETVFQREIATFLPPEQETLMEVMTSWERKGLAKGRVEGRVEGAIIGQRQLIERQLVRKLGPLPAEVQAQLVHVPAPQLDALGEALLDFTQLAELVAWLAAHAATENITP